MEEKKTASSENLECMDSSKDADSIDDHPLFMTRIPSANDFKNNSMLAALAALIDEEEEEPQDPGPIRRQRRPPRPQPWTHAKWSNQRQRGNSSLRRAVQEEATTCPASTAAPVGSGQADTAGLSGRRGEELESQGEATDEARAQQERSSLGEAMDCEAGHTEGTTATTSHEAKQNNNPSLGELQICMRLFSMK
ncbi:hypothetical protein Emed_005179 [Eimeria media]